VEAGSPAHQAGLFVGDVIVAVQSQGKDLSPEVIAQRELSAGQEVTLRVLRGGASFSTQVTPTKG
jgi:C-terminal processing protease CtpA/Prc